MYRTSLAPLLKRRNGFRDDTIEGSGGAQDETFPLVRLVRRQIAHIARCHRMCFHQLWITHEQHHQMRARLERACTPSRASLVV